MLVKKDKEEIVDEVWTLERIKTFLDLVPPTGLDADYHCLNSAYKNMRLEDFEKFLHFFAQANRNFNALNLDGLPLTSIIKQHRRGKDYLTSLEKIST